MCEYIKQNRFILNSSSLPLQLRAAIILPFSHKRINLFFFYFYRQPKATSETKYFPLRGSHQNHGIFWKTILQEYVLLHVYMNEFKHFVLALSD